MQNNAASLIVVLGTGGTIAGTSAQAGDDLGYRSAQLGVAQLIAAVPALDGLTTESEQVAQIDSKDMSHAVWRALAAAVDRHLARADVRGIVVTHGTDTLEETAYFLQRVLAPAKPVVLVAAMRPATSLQADGPQNLIDGLTVAGTPGAAGVLAVLAGTVHGAFDLRKVHTARLDAFASGEAGAIGHVEHGRLRRHRDWPAGPAHGLARLATDVATWPRVGIVTSHAGADGRIVQALRQTGVQGIVVAATGNGTLHHELEEALGEASAVGIVVWRASRCLDGAVADAAPPRFASAGALTPVQARIELMLQLMPTRV
jgi:L-asparaginase